MAPGQFFFFMNSEILVQHSVCIDLPFPLWVGEGLFDLRFGHATTQTWAYSRVFGFFRFFFVKNKTLPRSNHLLKKTMENPFLDFLKYWPKLFKKKIRIEIWTFAFQICFRNQLRLQEVVKRKIHKYAYLCIFRLTTFSN